MVRVSGSLGAFSGFALHEGRLRSPSAIRTATLAAVPVGARTCFTSIQTISCSSAIATAANTTRPRRIAVPPWGNSSHATTAVSAATMVNAVRWSR